MKQYSTTATEIWESTAPRQVVIVGEDYDLACKLSYEYSGNVYRIDQIEGHEYLIAHMKCVYKDGEYVSSPKRWKPPKEMKDFFEMIGCDKVYQKGDTYNIILGDSKFVDAVVQAIMSSRYHKECAFDVFEGTLIYENNSLYTRLRKRFMEAGATEVFAIQPMPDPKILVTDVDDLDISDIMPEVTVIKMESLTKDFTESYFHLYSKGKFINES